MAINASVQYNGGLLPDIILLTQSMLFPSENPFICHEEVLYLQPLTSHLNVLTFSPPDWGICSEGLGANIIPIKQYFGEIKNERFLKNEVFFKDPEDVYSRSARPSASYTY